MSDNKFRHREIVLCPNERVEDRNEGKLNTEGGDSIRGLTDEQIESK